MARPHRGSARARGQPFNASDPALQGWAAEWCTRCCFCQFRTVQVAVLVGEEVILVAVEVAVVVATVVVA